MPWWLVGLLVAAVLLMGAVETHGVDHAARWWDFSRTQEEFDQQHFGGWWQ